MKKYKSYHTHLKFLAKRDTLPESYVQSINRSTLWRWRHEPDDKYTGHELTNLEVLEGFISRKESELIMRAYLKIAFMIGMIFSSSKTAYNCLKNNKVMFVHMILNHKRLVNIGLILRLLRIPRSVFYYWKDKVVYQCETSPIKLCKKRYPHQLTCQEVSVIKELALSNQFRFWPVCSLAWYAVRENLLHVSLATWYKYIKILGIKRPKLPKKVHHAKGIRAFTPNQMWHADITIVKTLDGLKNYVYLLMDNYSKYIINWRVEPVVSGLVRMQTIKDGYQNFIVKNNDVQLIMDGGPENNNTVLENYISEPGVSIKKLIALRDIPFSNSLIEAQNKLLKYQYLFKNQVADINALRKTLEWVVKDYNDIRPHNALNGLTPLEAYTGKKPDGQALRLKMKRAQQNRVIENAKSPCGIC